MVREKKAQKTFIFHEDQKSESDNVWSNQHTLIPGIISLNKCCRSRTHIFCAHLVFVNSQPKYSHYVFFAKGQKAVTTDRRENIPEKQPKRKKINVENFTNGVQNAKITKDRCSQKIHVLNKAFYNTYSMVHTNIHKSICLFEYT